MSTDITRTESRRSAAQHVVVADEKEKNSSLDEKESIRSSSAPHPHAHQLDENGDLILINDGNPFPEDPNAEVETQQLTVRAIVVGSLLGLIVGASNIYLGLKTGFTFGASLFGAIFGFAIIKPLSHALPVRWGGGYFGPKENCTVQTAATSAGGLTSLFVAAVPAMYHLELLRTPKEDIGILFALTAITAFYGLFFAIPLRRYYILKQKLVFPTPAATAFTIRSLHSTASPTARIAAKKKIWILAVSFGGSFTYKTLCGYAPGLLTDWHIFWWFYTWGWKGAIKAESWNWFIEITPAFFGAGMLSGLNASWSFLSGCIIAWGIIGPILIAKGICIGGTPSEDFPEYHTYFGMSAPGGDFINKSSPRYWMQWPGILIMLTYSFAELGASAPLFYKAGKQVVRNISYEYKAWSAKRANRDFTDERPIEDIPLEDPAPKHEQVPAWAWAGGLLISIAGTLIVAKLSFHMDVGVGILALILAFIFSFIGVQSSGTTDVNPVGTIAKASQLIIGGVTSGQGLDTTLARKTNLLAGAIAGQAASHGVDMTGDLKTGHLLRAAPVSQFWAQILGSVIGIWLSVGLFVLFSEAYPCMLSATEDCPAFGMPAVTAWRSVAIAVTSPSLPIHPTSGYTAVALALVAVLTVVLKYTVIPARYHVWVPNWNAIGLGFVVPNIYYAIAMVIGAHVAYSWASRNPKSWEIWGFALSAGLVAGEGMGGVMTALLTILKVDGSVYGSAIACPLYEYCG